PRAVGLAVAVHRADLLDHEDPPPTSQTLLHVDDRSTRGHSNQDESNEYDRHRHHQDQQGEHEFDEESNLLGRLGHGPVQSVIVCITVQKSFGYYSHEESPLY